MLPAGMSPSESAAPPVMVSSASHAAPRPPSLGRLPTKTAGAYIRPSRAMRCVRVVAISTSAVSASGSDTDSLVPTPPSLAGIRVTRTAV
jgi:hypothetical protein